MDGRTFGGGGSARPRSEFEEREYQHLARIQALEAQVNRLMRAHEQKEEEEKRKQAPLAPYEQPIREQHNYRPLDSPTSSNAPTFVDSPDEGSATHENANPHTVQMSELSLASTYPNQEHNSEYPQTSHQENAFPESSYERYSRQILQENISPTSYQTTYQENIPGAIAPSAPPQASYQENYPPDVFASMVASRPPYENWSANTAPRTENVAKKALQENVSGAPGDVKDLGPNLGKAIMENNFEDVRSLIVQFGVRRVAAIRNNKKQTPLHAAAASISNQTLMLLLPLLKDTCLNEIDKYGRTPLHWAAKSNPRQNIEEMLKHMSPEQVCMLDAQGSTPLSLAIENLHYPAVEALLPFQKPGLPIVSLRAFNGFAYKDNIEILRLFIKTYSSNGLNFWNITDGMKHTVLRSILSSIGDSTRLLLEAFHTAPYHIQRQLIYAVDLTGMTALGHAAAWGKSRNIQMFLDMFNDEFPASQIVNQRTARASPYFIAITRGHTACADILLKKYNAYTQGVEMCGLTAGEWLSNVWGTYERRGTLSLKKAPKYRPLSTQALQNRRHDRIGLLELTNEELTADPIKLFHLAMHYFTLISREFQDSRELQVGSIAQEAGTIIYALFVYTLTLKGLFADASCESCPKAFKSKLYACAACHNAHFCETCYQDKMESKTRPASVQCPYYHKWILIDLDTYPFANGYVDEHETIDGFLQSLRDGHRSFKSV